MRRLHALTSKAANLVLTRLAQSGRGRQLLHRSIGAAQEAMGIGSGGSTDASGEQAVFEHLRRLSSAEAGPLCIFDVGANQGQFLDLIERGLAGVQHEVHCFEPSPATFEILQGRAIARPGVYLNPFGLGQAAGEFDLFSDAAGSGLASLTKRRLDHFGIKFDRRERVRLETLDGYCHQHRIQRIDLLKIDVEGHELEVLRGSEAMFAENRISILTFEFGGCNIDSRTFLQDFFRFFQAHRMSSLFRILPSGRFERISGYSESLEQFRTTNYLVLHDGLAGPPQND